MSLAWDEIPGTGPDILTDVNWTAVNDLGFTAGLMHTRIDPLDATERDPRLPAALPSGRFELYTELFGLPDLLDVWEWHPEYGPHYSGTREGQLAVCLQIFLDTSG